MPAELRGKFACHLYNLLAIWAPSSAYPSDNAWVQCLHPQPRRVHDRTITDNLWWHLLCDHHVLAQHAEHAGPTRRPSFVCAITPGVVG